jgi:hypothetical protein
MMMATWNFAGISKHGVVSTTALGWSLGKEKRENVTVSSSFSHSKWINGKGDENFAAYLYLTSQKKTDSHPASSTSPVVRR